MRLVLQRDCRSSETISIRVRGAGSEAMAAERIPNPSDEVRFLAGPLRGCAWWSNRSVCDRARFDSVRRRRVAPPRASSKRRAGLPNRAERVRFSLSAPPQVWLEGRASVCQSDGAGSIPATCSRARCSGSDRVCKTLERGSTPRRASKASARGRDPRLLNTGQRDRHAPEAPRRIRLVAQDAGLSIQQRGFDSLMRRHISTHGGQQVYEASLGGSTPPGDTTFLFVVGRSRPSEGCAPGSNSRRRGCGRVKRFHVGLISRRHRGSTPRARNADDPRRDARFISAAARTPAPKSMRVRLPPSAQPKHERRQEGDP
jgi:hypothetical protein